MVFTCKQAELGSFLQASLPDDESQGRGGRNRGESLCKSCVVVTAGLCRKDAEVMVYSHVRFGSQESVAKVSLAPSWRRSAEGRLLSQLFLMMPANLALLSGNRLVSVGISPGPERILWTIVSETRF